MSTTAVFGSEPAPAIIESLNCFSYYSFADDRALKAAGYFGLPDDDASKLAERVDDLLPTKNEEEKRRRQFATVVEALAAADLEHRYEDLVEELEAAVDGEPPEKRERVE